jgi:hypothetical protein
MEPTARWEDRSARQFGALARAQAIADGVPPGTIDAWLRSGEWSIEHPGVYVVRATPRTWERRAMAALLYGDPAALSHSSAAFLHGLIERGPLRIDISTGRNLRSRELRIQRTELPSVALQAIDPFVVTSPAQTLLDLAGETSAIRLEMLLEEILFRHLDDLTGIKAHLDLMGTRGRKRVTVLRRLIEDRDPEALPTANAFETLVLVVLRRAGLPDPSRRYQIWDAEGLIKEVDFAYPRKRIAIESHGYRVHGRRREWERDLATANRLLAAGWRLRQTSWTEVKHRPDRLVDDIWKLWHAAA